MSNIFLGHNSLIIDTTDFKLYQQMSDSSSDDVATKRHRVPEKKELWDQVGLDCVIFSYGIKLRKPHKLPPKYTYITDEKSNCFDECESLCAEDCLEMLLSFIYTVNCPSAKAAIDEVLKGPTSRTSIALGLLLQNRSFYPTNFKPDTKEETYVDNFLQLDGKLTALQEMFESKTPPINKKVEHDTVKDFFYNFCYTVINDGLMTSGSRVLPILVDFLPKMGPERPTKKAAPKYQIPLHATVTVTPDLMIGWNFNTVATPVEVYAPHLYEKDIVCPYHGSETENSDDEYASLPTFLANLPPFRGHARSLSHFQCKLTVQLLLQLLASSNECIRFKADIGQPFNNERRSFIGIFAHRFDVYIIKLETSERDLFFTTSVGAVSKIQNPITVQFFPVPLDLSNANHAIAFAVFLKYYRNIYKVQN